MPGVNAVAMRWWIASQESAFQAALESVSAPKTPWDPARHPVDVPSLSEVADRSLQTVTSGDEFAADMATWCSTSKFRDLGYQDVYARVVAHLKVARPRILEVGIGVNDPNAPSGMEEGHRPGASLVGWANYFPGAEVHGADIDRRVLVDTDFYSTHWVDQPDATALRALGNAVGTPLHLVVDDGLHTAEANGLTAAALLPLLAPDGVLVIEDILPEYDAMWDRASSWLRPEYQLAFFPGKAMRGGRGEGLAVFWRRG